MTIKIANQFPKYEFLQETILREMSQLYKVRDRQTGQLAMIKVIDTVKTQKDNTRWGNIPTEGEISVLFDHPYIVKTLEHGFTSDGEQYLITEHFEGITLCSILLVPRDILGKRKIHYMRQVAEAILEVHKTGFIHWDICTQNLIFNHDMSVLKLIDFGMALPNKPPFTESSEWVGSPSFMAPEVLRHEKKDTRLDIFSFGVTMYNLFCGKLPWGAGEAGVEAVKKNTPYTSIQSHCPTINETIVKAIHSCIEPDVNNRCPSMEHFLEMIQGVETEI